MSVYVDDLAFRNAPWHGGRSCHLVADTDVELDDFAAKLGLRRAWRQPAKNGRPPHYDMGPKFRRRAVLLGAEEIEVTSDPVNFDPEFHMGCDGEGCDATGHKDAHGCWFMDPETKLVYCRNCAETRGLIKKDEVW